MVIEQKPSRNKRLGEIIREKKSRNVQQSEFSPGWGKSLSIPHCSWNSGSKDPHKILTS
jgi:hypothetical protein